LLTHTQATYQELIAFVRTDPILFVEVDEPIPRALDKHSLQEIFRRIIIEEKRLAARFGEDASDAS
jgi:hypothetical protein